MHEAQGVVEAQSSLELGLARVFRWMLLPWETHPSEMCEHLSLFLVELHQGLRTSESFGLDDSA